jgi:hypothetical protein
MSLTGPTKIMADVARPAGGDHQPMVVASIPSGRAEQVAAALAADARAASASPSNAGEPAALTTADPAALQARQAALAAALQDWSGPTSRQQRTTALAVLAASRTAGVVQEATRAKQGAAEETVFEAFFRGVEGFASAQLMTGRGGQQ